MKTQEKIKSKGYQVGTTTNGKVYAKRGMTTITADNFTQLLKKIS
jgi:hypothetical protein